MTAAAPITPVPASSGSAVPRQVIVVGSGPSGLAAAYRLQQAGHRVRILEAGDEIGGKMQTMRRDGFLFERGPVIIPSAYKNLIGIATEIGMRDQLLPAGSVVGFARDGTVHFLRSDHLFLDSVKSKMLSMRAKLSVLKLFWDCLRVRNKISYEDLSVAADIDTETVSDYARRRGVNPEVLEYVIDSSIRAMIATRIDVISVVEFYFTFLKLLGTKLYALRDGMSSYTHALASRFDVQLGAEVIAVSERNGQALIRWRDKSGHEHEESAAGCIVAISARATAKILPDLDPWRQKFLENVRYFRVFSVNVALAKAPENNPAFIVQIPRSVHPGLIGIMLEHNKAGNRAPPGKGLLGLYTTAEWADELFDEPDDYVVEQLVSAAEQTLPGIRQNILWTRVNRWDPVMVYSRPGIYRELLSFKELREKHDRRVQLAGDYYSSSNMNSSTAAGERAARDLIKHMAR